MFVINEQIPLRGSLELIGDPKAAYFEGSASAKLSAQFVKLQSESYSYISIPICAIDGLPDGMYEVTATTRLSICQSVHNFALKTLFHSLLLTAPNYHYLTAYNHLMYPFALTHPHEDFSVIVAAKRLETASAVVGAEELPALSPSLLPHSTPAVSELSSVGRTGPRFITSVVFLKALKNGQ